MRRVALLTLLCFGCATVRVPVTPAAEPADAPGTIAPPLVELWMESSETVPAAERGQAAERAREAIGAALSRREVSQGALGAGDAVLFVRERAVGLTPARRTQQNWAKVGIVAGIVVVVAVAVAAAMSGGESRRRPPSAPAGNAKPAAGDVAVKPRASAAGAPAAGGPRAGPAGPPSRAPAARPLPPPRAYVYGYAPAPLFIDLDFVVAPRPLVLREDPPPDADEPYPGAPPPPADEPETRSEPAAQPQLQLPPLSETAGFAVEERGFFAGAQTALQLDLLDRATGAVLWSQAVRGDVDPLNPEEVSALLDQALEGAAWARRTR